MKYRNNQYPYSSYALYFFFLLGGGRLFEVGRLKSTFWGWVLIRGWALINFFYLQGGRLFEKTRRPIQIISGVTRLNFNVNKRLIKSTSCDT